VGPEPNPTTAIYNASAVKIYDALSSLVHYENNKYFLHLEKNALAYYNAGVNSKVVGLGPRLSSCDFTFER
jgi:hypothetical protein